MTFTSAGSGGGVEMETLDGIEGETVWEPTNEAGICAQVDTTEPPGSDVYLYCTILAGQKRKTLHPGQAHVRRRDDGRSGHRRRQPRSACIAL